MVKVEYDFESQLPTGSCVLKRKADEATRLAEEQLPTGSCVLKHDITCKLIGKGFFAATYG